MHVDHGAEHWNRVSCECISHGDLPLTGSTILKSCLQIASVNPTRETSKKRRKKNHQPDDPEMLSKRSVMISRKHTESLQLLLRSRIVHQQTIMNLMERLLLTAGALPTMEIVEWFWKIIATMACIHPEMLVLIRQSYYLITILNPKP